MRRSRYLLLAPMLLLVLQILPARFLDAQAAPAEIKTERWSQSSVDEWKTGAASEGLLISNNDGGEVRLDQGQSQGVLLGPPHQTDISFTALTVAQSAEVPPRTAITVEVRTSADSETWSDWQVLAEGKVATPVLLEGAARWAQYRLGLESQQPPASPVVRELVFSFFDTTQGPTLNASPPLQPVLGGQHTLTPRPQVITTEGWGARPQAPTGGQPLRAVVSVLPARGDPLAQLRLLQTTSLSETLPYAFVVEPGGTIIQGRPQPADAQGTVGLAFLGEPSAESRAAMAHLLAWLSQAYDLPVATLAVDQSADEELEQALRDAAEAATVRSRWLFPEGNTRDYTERLMLYNPGSQEAQAKLIYYPTPAEPVTLDYSVGAGAYLDVSLNDIFSDTVDLPLEVVANRRLVAEQTMLFINDSLNAAGIDRPSRSWYFAEGGGQPGTRTYLLLFNPHAAEVAAEVTLMNSEGLTKTQSLTIAPHSRHALRASDHMTGTFGAKVVAGRPIAAARTMRFASSGGHLSNGASAPSHSWYFAEGTAETSVTTTLSLLNPNRERTNVTLSIFTGDGTALSRSYALPATTRLTINLRDLAPGLGLASAITADRPIVAERTMLMGDGKVGTSTLGAPQTAYAWHFAEGRTYQPATEYLIIANPNDRPARLRVAFKTENAEERQALSLPRRSRIVLPVDDYVDSLRHTTDVFSNLPVVAERTILIDAEQGLSAHTSMGTPEQLGRR